MKEREKQGGLKKVRRREEADVGGADKFDIVNIKEA